MIIDILVLLILAVSALIAFMRGFIREVLTIVGVVGGLAASYAFGPMLVPLMDGWLGVDPNAEDPQKLFDVIPYIYVSMMLAYGSVFVLVVVVLSIISHMIAEAVKSVGLGAVDRSLGVVFGLVRGIVLLGILYMPLYLLVEKDTTKSWFEGSKSYVYIEMTAQALADFLPEEARKSLDNADDGGEGTGESGARSTRDPVAKTRDTLQRLDLLKKGESAAQAPVQDKGYSDRQREQMDQLFEDMDGNRSGENSQ